MEHKQIIKQIAKTILSELEYFSQNIVPHRGIGEDVLAYPGSSLTGRDQGSRQLNRIDSTMEKSNIQLQKEPFIAYVNVEVDGELRTIYICRDYIPKAGPKDKSTTRFASYKAPWGQVVEKDVNTSFPLHTPSGTLDIKIIEKDLFKPVRHAQLWDAEKNQFFLSHGIYSIESLRNFIDEYLSIESASREKETIVDIKEAEKSLLEALERELVVKEGLAREIRSKIALRDQPTLDSHQGIIFRLPVSTHLIITGAPGTGKTTTLIKRIAQKSNSSLLASLETERFSEDEIEDFFNNDMWVMYTPTELLKIYLKEAFAIENIPASDKRIRVWDEDRVMIGRDVLSFSKVGDKGYFSRTDSFIITVHDNSQLINFSHNFDEFYCNYIFDLFKQATSTIKSNNSTPQLINNFEKISRDLSKFNSTEINTRTFYLIEKLFESREYFNKFSKELNEEIENIIELLIESEEGVLQTVLEVINSFKKPDDSNDHYAEDIEEEDPFAEPSQVEPKTDDNRLIAYRQIRKTLIWYAQKIAKKQKLSEDTLNTAIINLLSNTFSNIDNLTSIGERILDRKATNLLTRGYSNLIERIPYYYQRFRLQLFKEEQNRFTGKAEMDIKNKKIDNNEYDLIIYTMLRNAQIVLRRHKRWIKNNSGIPLLEKIKSQYVTQVTVDEATDFSSIQLGSMFHLAHPLIQSVTFSGDLMQRLTPIGIKSWDDLKFISEAFETYNVTTVYRQSYKLLKIASKLYEHFIGETPSFVSAFKDSEADPDPLKFSSDNNIEKLAKWVAERIIEIYNINDTLPSIAIFVPEEDQIDETYDILYPLLMDHSIDLEACSRGKILSTESKVRIFSVRYIKGLEFESVFFINLDKLSTDLAALIDKYLYVGLTRAASFLAITFTENFPDKIRFIENDFKTGDWKYLGL